MKSANELLLLDTESNRIHRLSRTARHIWQRCDSVPPHTIAAELVRHYDVCEEHALSDVVRMLETFRSLNLVLEA